MTNRLEELKAVLAGKYEIEEVSDTLQVKNGEPLPFSRPEVPSFLFVEL